MRSALSVRSCADIRQPDDWCASTCAEGHCAAACTRRDGWSHPGHESATAFRSRARVDDTCIVLMSVFVARQTRLASVRRRYTLASHAEWNDHFAGLQRESFMDATCSRTPRSCCPGTNARNRASVWNGGRSLWSSNPAVAPALPEVGDVPLLDNDRRRRTAIRRSRCAH